MKLWQIDSAIAGMCADVEESVARKNYQQMTEKEIVHELLICILGSGVRYEIAVSYASAITKGDCLCGISDANSDACMNSVTDVLNNEVVRQWGCGTYKKYRYPVKRSEYIVESIINIYNKYRIITNLLLSGYSANDLRREIIQLCPGVGPKQASHFLKNVGYCENLAILDRHIIRYLEMYDDVSIPVGRVSKIDFYEEVEAMFVKTVKRFNYSVSVIDQSMWFVMRAISREAVA